MRDILLSNMCECFNKLILKARDKPVLRMLEMNRCKCMVRIPKKREMQAKWTAKLCPKILIKLNKNVKLLGTIGQCMVGQMSLSH